MTSEALIIKTMTSGGAAVFPNEETPAELPTWTFDATRMGATRIDATLEYPSCLDDVWTGREFVEFRGERFILQSTPPSSKDTSTVAYKHNLSFLAERDIVLSATYFFDAVSGASTTDDKYKSNDTKVIFYGTLEEFVARLNQSLAYSGLRYSVVIDAGIVTEARQVSFEDKYISEVLQDSFDTWNVPFYFVGDVCHFGYTDNAIPHVFKYDGANGDLLAVKRNSKGTKIVRRCTGTGSADNIPHYYPNFSPKGEIKASAAAGNTTLAQSQITIVNAEKYCSKVNLGEKITRHVGSMSVLAVMYSFSGGGTGYNTYSPGSEIAVSLPSSYTLPMWLKLTLQVHRDGDFTLYFGMKIDNSTSSITSVLESCTLITPSGDSVTVYNDGAAVSLKGLAAGQYSLRLKMTFHYLGRMNYKASFTYTSGASGTWRNGNGEDIDLSDIGISVSGSYSHGDGFIQEKGAYITPCSVLMPPIYRQSLGAERFYNAVNGTLKDPDSGADIVFENEYSPSNPGEHKEKFEDIKPTVRGIKNASGQIIAQFLDIAFDKDDNDETDEEGNLLHPFFYVKLPKFDGDYGFNLFDQAIETAEMTFIMDSGACAPCPFRVMVGKETQKNLVQVDSQGNLMRDSSGNVRMNNESPQDRQNDTRHYEVWVALEKEDSTFGVIMPNALNEYRPGVGDTFVITGILLPNAYILKAEADLEAEIIRFMAANNSPQYGFSVDFSRISSEELPEIYAKIDHNARLQVEYNGKLSLFYVSHFTYTVTEGEDLPEVKVELSDAITVNRNALQNTISAVKAEMLSRMQGLDILSMCLPYFIRKDIGDRTPKDLAVGGKFTAEKGTQFGKDFAEGPTGFGGKVDEHGNGWFRNIFVAEALEAAEYRFNRVVIDLGNKWNGPGGGIIESFEPDYDEDGNQLNTGVITLKLEEGEIGAIAVDDICQGIYHDAINTDNNSWADSDDGLGNFEVSGFYTCYFRVTEILETGRNTKFAYALRPVSDRWPKLRQPHSLMHFIAYGNFSDKKRQTSRYSTRTYERYLKDVNNWEFTAENVGAQFGDLTNLSVFGMQMEGYSAYLNNIYMTGTIEQLEHIPLQMKIDTQGDNFLAYGESVVATCSVFKGWDDVTASVKSWSVVRDSGDPSDDQAWLLKDKVKNFSGQLEICYTKDENDLGTAAVSTLFTFTAELSDGSTAAYTITV